MSAKQATLLVVEDDPGLQKQLRWSFDGYDVLVAGDRDAALNQLRRHEPPVMLLDLGLPPDADGASEGLATLQQVLSLVPATKVIVVSGNQHRENAVRAIALGAYDFYQKPFDADSLRLMVGRAFHVYELEAENRALRTRSTTPMQGIVSNSPQMQRVCQVIEKVAPSTATVLLLGESGTGKEVLARALHQLSPRADKRFVAINCAAIPDQLLESELFGYEKGAFTGAVKQTAGRIEHADGGTLFLDEIGDLPMSLQAKLLRFLQERVIERLGGRREIPVDVRVICATHQHIAALIKAGQFREDLYYRISEITVNIPPLRERRGDSALIAHAFLERYGRQQGRSFKGFSPEALASIENYAWPGNVRELENVIKRAVIMADGQHLGPADLCLDSAETPEPLNLRQVREVAEKEAVARALARSNGNILQAAEILGVSRPTLYDMLNKYNLK